MLLMNQVMINIWHVAPNTIALLIVSPHTDRTRTHTSHHAPQVGVFYCLLVIQSTAPATPRTGHHPHRPAGGQGSKKFYLV